MFLENPEWKTVPWALDPGAKSSIALLQDIFCHIPGLIERVTNFKRLEGEPMGRATLAQELKKDISHHLLELYKWRRKYEDDNSYFCVEVPAASQQPPDEQALFPTFFRMSNLSCAYEIILYDAALIMLLGFGGSTIGPSFDVRMSEYPNPHATRRGPLFLPGEAQHPRAVAIELCKIAEYCLCAHPNSAGLWLISPLKVAYLSFPPASREAKWLSSRMAAIADLSGFEIGRHQDRQPPIGSGGKKQGGLSSHVAVVD